MSDKLPLTGKERQVKISEIISTRTDPQGLIAFANAAFLQVTGFTSDEVLGKPHNIVRHPDVPRCIYSVLWQSLRDGETFFGVTKNHTKSGDHYWTFGYFHPDIKIGSSEVVGYRSTRKGFHDTQLKQSFDELFSEVRQAELAQPRAEQVKAGLEALKKALKKRGFSDYQGMSRLALA
jgi:PAS domain-containing protein